MICRLRKVIAASWWQEAQQLQVDLLGGGSSPADAPLTEVSRGQVFSSCVQVRTAAVFQGGLVSCAKPSNVDSWAFCCRHLAGAERF